MSKKNKLPSPSCSLTIELSEDRLLTKEGIAKYFDLSVKTVDRRVASDDWPYIVVGGSIRFSLKRVLMSCEFRGYPTENT
jgi:hypothetical protein